MRGRETSQAKRQEQVQAKVTAAAEQAGPIAAPVRRSKSWARSGSSCLNAGFRQEQAVAVFYGIKLIGLLIGLAVAFPPASLHSG